MTIVMYVPYFQQVCFRITNANCLANINHMTTMMQLYIANFESNYQDYKNPLGQKINFEHNISFLSKYF